MPPYLLAASGHHMTPAVAHFLGWAVVILGAAVLMIALGKILRIL